MITGKNGISKDLWKTWESGQREILWYQETNRLALNLEKKEYCKVKCSGKKIFAFSMNYFLQSNWL